MPRQAAPSKDQVIRYYLTAPLGEIEDLQGTLREIYNVRNRQRQKSIDGKLAAQVEESKKAAKKQIKKGKKDGAGDEPTWGGKEVQEEATA